MIKGIKSFFSKKTDELGIKILKELRLGSSFIVMGLLNGKKVIFKLRRERRSYSVIGLKTEILAGKILQRKELAARPFRYRGIASYSIDYPQWGVFEYKDGEKASSKKCRYWCFSEDFYKANPSEKMFKIIKFWQEDITRFASLNNRSFPYHFKKCRFSQILSVFRDESDFYFTKHIKRNAALSRAFSKSDKKNGEKMLKKFKNLIDSNNKYICHGDMHPGNFLVDKEKITLIDFESVHYDVPGADLAFVWLAGWNNLKWRKELLELFLDRSENKEIFKILFSLNVIRFFPHVLINMIIAPGYEKSLSAALGILQKDYEEAIGFLDSARVGDSDDLI